jgi:diguanylate cyclase (GGDEF)-like protein
MRQRLRSCDTLARWGGEEFMVLLPETTLLQAASVAEALRAELHALTVPAVRQITASFGVADYRPAETLDAWLKRLDDLVYQAKRAGRDRVVRAAQDRDGGAAALASAG